jgi:metallo-beta-lactamase family protein
VVSINGLSAHAGQKLLLDYALAVKDRVKKIYLVHGEEDAAGIFMGKLRELGMKDVVYPQFNDVAEL